MVTSYKSFQEKKKSGFCSILSQLHPLYRQFVLVNYSISWHPHCQR
jgi:hypothetical protein